jgi:hypothetical protein
MASDFNSNTQTIERVVNIDLKKQSYRKIDVQYLKVDRKQYEELVVNGLEKKLVTAIKIK